MLAGPARAAAQVDLDGRIVAVQGTRLVLDVDGVVLTLDASEVDPRFLQTLRPGDEVHVTAFRQGDGGLLVYNVFLRPDDRPTDREPRSGPQGGTD
jgi:hypothetical protein